MRVASLIETYSFDSLYNYKLVALTSIKVYLMFNSKFLLTHTLIIIIMNW